MTARTGDQYKSKDIRNLLQKLKNKVANGDNLEKELDLVRNNGRIIRVDKDTNTIVCGFRRHNLLNKPGRLQINDPHIS